MNAPLTNNQALAERIEGKIDTTRVAETALTATGGGLVFTNLSEVLEVAKLMALSDVAVPKHLRNNPGACLAVTIQAVEWKMSPFAVANKSYSVNDRLAYESQLVQAVILQRAPLKGRFEATYEGEGASRKCTISAELTDGTKVFYQSPPISQIKVKNSPLWTADPDQQLFYYSARALCRRHFPDVLLGVYAKDEAESEPKDITPKGSGLADRLTGEPTGGFNADDVAATLDQSTGWGHSTSVDWTNVAEATAAIGQHLLPPGLSVRDGMLILPDSFGGRPRGHHAIVALFDEVRTESGGVVKTKAQPDPEFMRAGAQGFSDGEQEPPEDFTEEQKGWWRAGWEEAQRAAEGGAS